MMVKDKNNTNLHLLIQLIISTFSGYGVYSYYSAFGFSQNTAIFIGLIMASTVSAIFGILFRKEVKK